MWSTIKDLSLGLGLLVAASAALLLSDLSSRETSEAKKAPEVIPVAMLQHASNPILDEVAQGVIDGLSSRGFRDGEKIHLQRFNAEGDIPTANLIASRVTDGSFRLVSTISTVCLQAVANANRNGHTTQVFCSVSDPVIAGVGIKSLDSLDKPAHLTGIGTSQPVEDIFRLAKRIRPDLKRVGVVWNPAEANSEACTKRARAICRELDIELLEASIEGTRDVKEAAQSVAARGAQAFWTGGDVTVINAMDVLVGAAKQAKIPIFSNISGHTKRGAFFDLGANYYEVGRRSGEIAGDILAGKSAAEIPVVDYMPKEFTLNLQVLSEFKESWQPPNEVVADAASVIDADGKVIKKEGASPAASATPAASGSSVRKGPYRISAIGYNESVPSEETLAGFKRGFEEASWVENRDYTWNYRSAQGDMSLLPSLFAAAELDRPDLIVTLSTPTLQTALRRAKGVPVVFSLVADPVASGAGKSNEDHLPGITGVSVLGPYEGMVDLLATHYPQWKRVGSLVTPAEDNSVNTNKLFKEALARRGITLVNVAVNQSNEITEAANALCRQNIDAIVQVPDNMVSAGFSAIVGASRRNRVPLFGLVQNFVKQGASLALSRDYEDAGHDAALVAVRVLKGEDPGKIPFTPPRRTVLTVNPAAAKAQGITIPPELLEKADLTVQ